MLDAGGSRAAVEPLLWFDRLEVEGSLHSGPAGLLGTLGVKPSFPVASHLALYLGRYSTQTVGSELVFPIP